MAARWTATRFCARSMRHWPHRHMFAPYVGEVTASSPAGVYRTALRRLGNDDARNINSALALKRIFDMARHRITRSTRSEIAITDGR